MAVFVYILFNAQTRSGSGYIAKYFRLLTTNKKEFMNFLDFFPTP